MQLDAAPADARFRELPYSVSIVRSADPHPLLLSVSVAVEVLHVVHTTTVTIDDPLSSLEAAAVRGTHDFSLGGGAGQQCNGSKHNGLHFKFSLEGD
jgi:hypothetical protein